MSADVLYYLTAVLFSIAASSSLPISIGDDSPEFHDNFQQQFNGPKWVA